MITRKRLVFLLTLIILLCYTLSVLAAGTEVKLLINDQVAKTNLEVKKVDNTLLIPLKVLEETFNIEVEWMNLIESANIKLNGQLIKLRAGEDRVQVGDEIKKLAEPVTLEGERVLIPANFIAEILGYKIIVNSDELKFSKPSLQVKDVTYQKGKSGEEIIIETNKRPRYDIKSLTDPERLIIDVFDSRLAKEIEDIAVNNGLVFQIRSEQFKTDRVRIVLDLYQPLSYQTDVVKKKDSYQFKLKISSRITDFKYNKKKNKFSILATEELKNYETKFLGEKNKLVVDFPNVILDMVQEEVVINNDLIKKVKLSQIEKEDTMMVRFAFQTKKWFKFDIFPGQKNPRKLNLKPNNLIELLDVKYDSQGDNIKIETKRPVTPKAIPLKKEARLVLDFPNTIFREVRKDFKFEDEFIEEVRVGQFDKDIARVVIDLKELVNYELKTTQNGEKNYNTVVRLELPDSSTKLHKQNDNEEANKKETNKKEITKDEDRSEADLDEKKLESIQVTEKKNKIKLQVDLSEKSNYKVREFSYPDRLVIDIPGAVTHLKSEQIPAPKGMIRDIRVSQFSREPLITRVVLELPYKVNYEVSSQNQAKQIELKFADSNQGSILSDRTIVIDAGHGGADPGAIGPQGTMEKYVNLDITRRLTNLLREAGANVKMTRQEDRYITLWSRASLANKSNCDIFVSIHSNAHKGKNTSGTETYVYPGSYGDTLVLAKKIQKSLHDELTLIDRGVKFDKLYVLEKTTMPSVLSEVAFITNPKEEKLLVEPDFRQKAAKGIYKGIVAFFNQSGKED